MKVLLLQPPVQDFYHTEIRLQPIGLCYLKAAIRKHLPDVEVVVKDYHHGWGRRSIPIPHELAYLKDFYCHPDQSPFSSLHHYHHFGAPFDVVADDVAQEQPDLVGISVLCSAYHREALRCAHEIKVRVDVPILAGGPHVSAKPEQVLAHPCIDFVIRGEGERPLVAFLRTRLIQGELEKVPNLGFKSRDDLHLNPIEENYPIDELPEPDLSDFRLDRYRYNGRPLAMVIASRSCPHHCAFCAVHSTFGNRFRRRSIALVMREVQRRYAEGFRVFDFEDDNLTYEREPMAELCRRLKDAFPERDVTLLAMNGICYQELDEELLRLMKEAGFESLNLSLVSTDAKIAAMYQRPHRLEKYLEVVRNAHRLGLKVVSYQILGLPGDRLESMVDTLVFAARLPVLLGPSLFYSPPGSPLAQRCAAATEADLLKSRATAMALETEDFRREDVYTLFLMARMINFLKGLRLTETPLTLEKALSLACRQSSRSAIGAEILRKLLAESRLYARTSQGLEPVGRFQPGLFSRVWSQLDEITTVGGERIRLRHPAVGITDGYGGARAV